MRERWEYGWQWFDKGRVHTTQSAAVIQWFFFLASPEHKHIMHVCEYVPRLTPTFHFSRRTAHTIKNIENCVMYLMGGNTQADNDDSQINCVIEPFYFIDGFNEFRWQFSAADTPSLFISPFVLSLLLLYTLQPPLIQRLPISLFQFFFSWISPSDLLQMVWKPRENVTKMLVN